VITNIENIFYSVCEFASWKNAQELLCFKNVLLTHTLGYDNDVQNVKLFSKPFSWLCRH